MKSPTPIIADVPRIALTPEDAAAALGITKRMLQELVRAGKIACVRLGPQTEVFDPDDLRELVKANKRSRGSSGMIICSGHDEGANMWKRISTDDARARFATVPDFDVRDFDRDMARCVEIRFFAQDEKAWPLIQLGVFKSIFNGDGYEIECTKIVQASEDGDTEGRPDHVILQSAVPRELLTHLVAMLTYIDCEPRNA